MPPAKCVLVVGAIYAIAAALAAWGLFNGALWAWLVEMTVFFWYLLKRGEPHGLVLFALLWSGLVMFCVGLTLVLRRWMMESRALAVSLLLTILQFGQIFLLAEWIAVLCNATGHGCPCQGW